MCVETAPFFHSTSRRLGDQKTTPTTSIWSPEAEKACQILPPHLSAQLPIHLDITGEKLSAPSWQDFSEIVQLPLELARTKLQKMKFTLPEGPPLTRPSEEGFLLPKDDEYLDQQIMVTFKCYFVLLKIFTYF